ncbi:MAG: hypothetical protein QOJ25_1069 [Solirubrobacteraceae bacterium]|nr:hypothetical protein [Solirubrobacteraceae bacterium]
MPRAAVPSEMLVSMLSVLAAAGRIAAGPFLAMAGGFVVATFGHIIKSRVLIVFGLAVIAGVSVYALYVVRPRG